MKSSIGTLNECEITLKKDWITLSKYKFSNITCNAWRWSIAKRLYDNTSNLGVARYIAIGTSNTTATITDTVLGAEIYRQAVDVINSTNIGSQAIIYTSFPTWPTYTVKEAGVFLDATATNAPNTWSLLCHSIFTTPVTKPSDQVLTVKWTININNA